jgi:hypothetical protein
VGIEYYGGPRTLNGLAVESQTFAVSSSGTDFGIASSGTAHTFSIPDASAIARGLVTTGSQTIAGGKTFTSTMGCVSISITAGYGLAIGGDVVLQRDTSGTLAQRNSTTVQSFGVYGTYTSSTSYERVNTRGKASANFEIGPENGSAGGTLRGLTIGGYSAGSTTITPWLTFDNAGVMTTSAGLGVLGTPNASVALHLHSSFARAILFNNSSIGITNSDGAYIGIDTDGIFTILNQESGSFRLGTNNAINVTMTGPTITLSPSVATTGSPTAFTLTGAAHTTLTASTEATDVNFNLARTVQFATGALTTQRAFRVQAPTYSFVGASTITTASTFSISGPPVAGTNATITSPWALNVESGHSRFNGNVSVSNGSTFWTISPTALYFATTGGIGYGGFDSTGFGIGRGLPLGFGSGAANIYSAASANVFLRPDGAGILAQRNSTNAQTFRAYNTYTSSTNFENLQLKANTGAAYQIGSAIGSAGGTNRAVEIGHFDSAGTFTSSISIATGGTVTSVAFDTNVTGGAAGSFNNFGSSIIGLGLRSNNSINFQLDDRLLHFSYYRCETHQE